MTRYSALSYIVPPREQGRVEVAFALTNDEIVRRTTDRSDGSVTYETADLCELCGDFDPQNRVPSVFRGAWTRVDGSDLTPA